MGLNVPSLQQLASGLPKQILDGLRAALSAQDKFNTDLGQDVGPLTEPGPWLTPQYQNGWTDLTAGTRFVRYRLEMGGQTARIEGTMANGTVNTVAFTMPQAFFPAQRLNFAVTSNGLYGTLKLDTDGTATLSTGSNLSANLNATWAVV